MDAILNWICQGTIVAAATTAVLAIIERSRAHDRHLAVWVAMVSVLTLPIVAALRGAAAVPAIGVALPPADGGPLLAMPVAWWTSNTFVLTLWALWAAATGSRFVRASLRLRHVKQASVPMPERRQARLGCWTAVTSRGRQARLVVSPDVRSAAVLGYGSPVIAVAPPLLEQLSEDDLDRIVIHEWAHVQRRDDLTDILQWGIHVVAGWHPAVWWLDRQLRIEREIACDELAVAITGSAKGYAASLVTLAELPLVRVSVLPALAAVASSGLQRRVARILTCDRRMSRRAGRFAAAAAGMSLSVLAAMVADVRAIEAAAITESTATIQPVRADVNRAAGSQDLIAPVASARRLQPRLRAAQRGERGVAARDESARRIDDSAAPPPVAHAAEPMPDARPMEIAGLPVSGAFNAAAPAALIPPGSAARTRVPWHIAADEGVALGRSSRNAAVATAGYFTHLSKQVASSF